MKVTIHNQPADTSNLPYAEQMVQLLAAGSSQQIERTSGQRIALYGYPEIADIFVQFDSRVAHHYLRPSGYEPDVCFFFYSKNLLNSG